MSTEPEFGPSHVTVGWLPGSSYVQMVFSWADQPDRADISVVLSQEEAFRTAKSLIEAGKQAQKDTPPPSMN
jgi:hypothetical protein